MKRVLVVDDSPVVRNFHINILKTSGFEAEGAMDGVEAMEKALTDPFDLILCDINMPNMDGLTFIKRFRESEDDTPIIILTTQSQEVQRKIGYEHGANLFIVKPVKPKSLVLHIQMLLGDKR